MQDMKIIYKYLNIYNSSLWVICGLLGAHCSYDNPLDVRGGNSLRPMTLSRKTQGG